MKQLVDTFNKIYNTTEIFITNLYHFPKKATPHRHKQGEAMNKSPKNQDWKQEKPCSIVAGDKETNLLMFH